MELCQIESNTYYISPTWPWKVRFTEVIKWGKLYDLQFVAHLLNMLNHTPNYVIHILLFQSYFSPQKNYLYVKLVMLRPFLPIFNF